MRFEWDESKNTAHIRKHKIDFCDVPSVFDAPLMVEYDDRQDYGKDRWIGIGTLRGIIVVVVVFTEGFFREAKLWQPRPKVMVTVEMDADVLEWFKNESDNWEARLQAALRLYVETHKAYQKT